MMNPTPRAKTFHSLSKDLKLLFTKSFLLKKNHYFELKQRTTDLIEKKLNFLSNERHIRLFPYARTALYCFLKSLNLPDNSEVIITGAHIKGFLSVIESLNLKPVIIDIECRSFSLDHNSLKKALNKNTKVVVITYLFGYVPDVKSIIDLIPKDIKIVEDISQNIGSSFRGKHLGNFGDIALISTSLGKYIDGNGGAIMLISKRLSIKKIDKIGFNLLTFPSLVTNIKRQLKSIIFNLLTSQIVFPFCFFIIFLFEQIIPDFFKRFGASDFLKSQKTDLMSHLTSIHFQDISPHSLELIQEEIPKLFERISRRRKQVKLIVDTLKINFSIFELKEDFKNSSNTFNTYWQLVLNVDTKSMRKNLLRNNIESSCSNLSNLFFIYKNKFDNKTISIGTNNLFNKTIFFPLNNELTNRDLMKNIKIFEKLLIKNHLFNN